MKTSILIAYVLILICLKEWSAAATTVSDKVVEAIDHYYPFADAESWKALRLTLLAESAASLSLLDKQLMQVRDSDLRIVTADQVAVMQAETAGEEQGIGLVDFAVTLDPSTERPQVVHH